MAGRKKKAMSRAMKYITTGRGSSPGMTARKKKNIVLQDLTPSGKHSKFPKRGGGKSMSGKDVSHMVEHNIKNDPATGRFERDKPVSQSQTPVQKAFTPKTAAVGFNVSGVNVNLRYSKRMGLGFSVKPTRSKGFWWK